MDDDDVLNITITRERDELTLIGSAVHVTGLEQDTGARTLVASCKGQYGAKTPPQATSPIGHAHHTAYPGVKRVARGVEDEVLVVVRSGPR
jgi:hypothetical protein